MCDEQQAPRCPRWLAWLHGTAVASDAPFVPVVALAGNPNAGKSTIFNALTGARQHVGNWPGKTVDVKAGTVRWNGSQATLVDLPGAYSLSAHSLEEVIARDFILDEHPDVTIVVLDATNLERNLYLAVQVMELGAPVALALNMMDRAEAAGTVIDVDLLHRLLGVPAVATVGTRRQGLEDLLSLAIRRGRVPTQGCRLRPGHGAGDCPPAA